MTGTQTVEQLKAQAAELLAQAEKAEREAKEAAAKAARAEAEKRIQEERAQEMAKKADIGKKVFDEFKKHHPDATTDDYLSFKCGREVVSMDFDKHYPDKTRWSYGRWSGNYRIVVGRLLGDRTSYPALKDGEYNYEKIAFKLAGVMSSRKAASKRAAQATINEQVAKALREELGLHSWDSMLQNSTDEAKPISMSFTFRANLTVDQARKIVELQKQIKDVVSNGA